jgi:hypothetical protein
MESSWLINGGRSSRTVFHATGWRDSAAQESAAPMTRRGRIEEYQSSLS